VLDDAQAERGPLVGEQAAALAENGGRDDESYLVAGRRASHLPGLTHAYIGI
jgi:hypothetical protein